MKKLIVISSILFLGGCTITQTKLERYRYIADKASNPEHVKVIYERHGDTSSFIEQRCSGQLCKEIVK